MIPRSHLPFTASAPLRFFLVLVAAVFLSTPTKGQVEGSPLRKRVTLSLPDSLPLEQGLRALGEAADVLILYSRDYLPAGHSVGGVFEDAMLGHILQSWLQGTKLVFVAKEGSVAIQERQAALSAADRSTVSGYIRKGDSGEVLAAATFYVPALRLAVMTNQQGFFSLSLPKGSYEGYFGAMGFKTKKLLVNVGEGASLDVQLDELHLQLGQVDILSNQEARRKLTYENINRVSLNVRDIKDTPAFLGEVDPIKSLQLFPGVQQSGDGSTGLFVRGGGADQNLILMEDAPIYNAAHLLGFFSTFNADAIKEVSLYKGGIPARYGGRLSSILDIQLREGNYENPQLSGGIGSLASRVTAELPFAKGKGSIIGTARRTYLDLLLQSLPNSDLSRNKLFFYDLNLKATYKPTARQTLSLSIYAGKDNISLQELFGTNWGNQAVSLRWGVALSDRVYAQTTAFYTNFSVASEVNLVSRQFGYFLNYDLQDMGLKHSLTYYLSPKLELEAGIELVRHRYLFGQIQPSSVNSLVDPQKIDPAFALESAMYVSAEQELAPKLYASWGVRGSRFDNVGPASVYLYDVPAVVSPETSLDDVVDTLRYSKGKSYHHYMGLEPRASAWYEFDQNQSVKLSYNRTRQYIHRLTNTNTPSPVDMWAPVNQYIPPQIADQFSLGYQRFFGKQQRWELSVEGYLKYMKNQVDFKPQASLFLNNHLETELLLGKGESYGVELLLRRRFGKLKGWLSYTLSKSERQINGINRNRPYPTSFDRRHNVAVVMSYQAGKRVQLSANWIYASGIAYTFPVGKYQVEDFVLPYYTSRNGFRLEPVHRLDLSVAIFREMTEDRKNESSFVFSIYNAYARKNTYAYLFRQSAPNSSRTETIKLYLFSIVPSFTYNFSF